MRLLAQLRLIDVVVVLYARWSWKRTQLFRIYWINTNSGIVVSIKYALLQLMLLVKETNDTEERAIISGHGGDMRERPHRRRMSGHDEGHERTSQRKRMSGYGEGYVRTSPHSKMSAWWGCSQISPHRKGCRSCEGYGQISQSKRMFGGGRGRAPIFGSRAVVTILWMICETKVNRRAERIVRSSGPSGKRDESSSMAGGTGVIGSWARLEQKTSLKPIYPCISSSYLLGEPS